MTLALMLAATLTASPTSAPLRTDLFQARLDQSVGTLVPELAKGSVYGGVSNVVAGSILLVLGGLSATGGIYSLVGAANATGNAQTIFTVLGWTFVGFGGVLALVGIPLLVVGIVRLARPNHLGLSLTSSGQLAVTF